MACDGYIFFWRQIKATKSSWLVYLQSHKHSVHIHHHWPSTTLGLPPSTLGSRKMMRGKSWKRWNVPVLMHEEERLGDELVLNDFVAISKQYNIYIYIYRHFCRIIKIHCQICTVKLWLAWSTPFQSDTQNETMPWLQRGQRHTIDVHLEQTVVQTSWLKGAIPVPNIYLKVMTTLIYRTRGMTNKSVSCSQIPTSSKTEHSVVGFAGHAGPGRCRCIA